MASIEIKTVQNVCIRYELAGFWSRLFAMALDWVLLGIFGFILVVIALATETWGDSYEYWAYFFLIVFTVYTPVSEYFLKGASAGKRIMNLRVLRLDGQPCGLMDYLLRWAFRSIDIYLSAGFLAISLIGFSPRRQRLGEILSDTVVVQDQPAYHTLQGLLRLPSLQDYTPVYPGAARLREMEALLIKEVLTRYQRYSGAGHRRALEEMSRWTARRVGADPSSMPSEMDFLTIVLEDYVALTR